MVTRNKNFKRLNSGYLFSEIQKRKQAFQKENPDAKLISLDIGDTTEPISEHIINGFKTASVNLGTAEGYLGYGHPQGDPILRQRIADKIYKGLIQPEEVFISDGSKCDIGRLQMLFGPDRTIAIQDPAYPAYLDTTLLINSNLVNMPCLSENDFFPDVEKTPPCDVILFCSPHNPTATVATKEQLQKLVEFAKANSSIIVFDSAYAAFIRDPQLPKSIYEIEGAREVAIEIGSFSKSVGFTGVRLGWSIVPEELLFEDGTPVKQDWYRLISTFFNGASNIAQMGGISALDDADVNATTFYLKNARILKQTLDQKYTTYGGDHSPYLWVHFPNRSSWDSFEEILSQAHIITTPGSGFGPSGEGFIRFSAFGNREKIEEAARRLVKLSV